MGMHIGLIAVKTSVAKFREAFPIAWPQLEIVASVTNLPDEKAFQAWKEANEKFVSAVDWSKDNPNKTVYIFWPNGNWSIMLDEDYLLASDDEGLKSLSRQLGIVLSFVVETAGGCAFFACFQDGQLIRKISNTGRDILFEGQALPEEQEIDLNDYYMKETEALWQAFGLTPYEVMQTTNGCEAISVIDHTDYSR